MPTQDDERFAQAAVRLSYMESDKAQEVLHAQKVAEDAAGGRIEFKQVALNKGFLTKEQVKAIEEALGITGKPKVNQFGPYLVKKKIGQGGMGAVYLAIDTRADVPVALKVLSSAFADNPTYLQRFQREAQMAAAIQHPNVVACYGTGLEKNIHYMALEYIDGGDVAKLMKQGPIPEPRALEIVAQVASALQAAHEAGIVHRDIKPSNIMLTKDGVAKLGDLGLARGELDHSLTHTSIVLGTPHYMSPEQGEGTKTLDIRGDIYSLGATLYHMVCGKPPFEGPTAVAVLKMHAEKQIPSPREAVPGLSDGTIQIIEKCMAKSPDDRYQRPAELLEDIQRVQRGEPPASQALPPDSTSVRRLQSNQTILSEDSNKELHELRRKKKGSPLPALVGMASLIFLAAGIYFFIQKQKHRGKPQAGGTTPGIVSQNQAPAFTTSSQPRITASPAILGKDAPPDIQRGLVGWWKFDEGKGKAVKDHSGQARDGNLMDFGVEPEWLRMPFPTSIKNEYALKLDGQKEYIDVPGGIPASMLGGNPKFICLWFFPGKIDEQALFYLGPPPPPGGGSGQTFRLLTNHELQLHLDVSDAAADSVITLQPDTWNFVFAYWNGNTFSVGKYEGNEVMSEALMNLPPSNLQQGLVWFGKVYSHPTTFYADGHIRDVRFYDRVLTKTEIKILAGLKKELAEGDKELAEDELNRREKTLEGLLAQEKFDDAEKLWEDFPENLLTEAIRTRILEARDRVAKAREAIVERLQQEAAPLLAKKAEELTADDIQAITKLKERAENLPEGIPEELEETLLGLVESLDAARVAYEEALTAKVEESFGGFWNKYEDHIKKKEFDKAATLASADTNLEGLPGDLVTDDLKARFKMLADDAVLLKTFFENLEKNLTSLKGQTIRLSGIGMQVVKVEPGKVYVKQGGAEMAWGIEKLESAIILKVALSSAEDAKQIAREKAVYLFYFGTAKETVEAMKQAAEAGEAIAFYQARMVPVLVVTSTPAGADVTLDKQVRKAKEPLNSENLSTRLPRKSISIKSFTIRVWNQYNGHFHDRGAKTITLVAFRKGKVVERNKEIQVPWKPGEDTFVDVRINAVFDRIRVEVQNWHGHGGGLCEVQIWNGDTNLALDASVAASSFHNEAGNEFHPNNIRDGITSSGKFGIGYWLLPDGGQAGWIELDLVKSLASTKGKDKEEEDESGTDLDLEKTAAESTSEPAEWEPIETSKLRTPLRLTLEKSRRYRVRLFQEGYEPFEKEIETKEGGQIPLAVRLKKSVMPPTLSELFETPSEEKDKHGNLIKKGTDKKTGLPLELRHKKTGMHFVLIPPGSFEMGSKLNEPNRGDEAQHTVELTKAFYFEKYEVTVEEWGEFVRETAYKTDAEKGGGGYMWIGGWQGLTAGAMWKNPHFEQNQGFPVVFVSWNDAQEYVRWMNKGVRTVAEKGFSFGLPTEAQWEYACRSGTKTRFFWGEDQSLIGRYANIADQAFKRRLGKPQVGGDVSNTDDGYDYTAPVGRFKPNGWGLYDMLGNVWEWCQDGAGGYPVGEVTDPQGVEGAPERILRGFGWDRGPESVRIAGRASWPPGTCSGALGLRLSVQLSEDILSFTNLPNSRDKVDVGRQDPPSKSLREGLILWLAADKDVVTDKEGRVGRWKDQSGKGNHAIQNNPDNQPTLTQQRKTERVGIMFDGNNDFLAIPDSDFWTFKDSFTIALWTKFLAIKRAAFITHEDGGGPRAKWWFGFYLSGNNAISFHFHQFEGSPPTWIDTENWNPQVDKWVHIALQKNNAIYTFFLNGVEGKSITNPTPMPNVNTALKIGQGESNFWFHGEMDDIRIYNRALRGEEVKALAQAGRKSAFSTERTNPEGGTQGKATGKDKEKDLQEDRTKNRNLVLIPGGKFLYGEPPNQQEIDLPAFYIGKYEVSNKEYAEFLAWVKNEIEKGEKGNPHRYCYPGYLPDGKELSENQLATLEKLTVEKRLAEMKKLGLEGQEPGGKNHDNGGGPPNLPAMNVDWYDAWAYCRWRGGRLPPEQEWEKAASWSVKLKRKLAYPWGDEFIAKFCNSNTPEDGFAQTCPVDEFPNGVSPYGCYNMSGNLWEWCGSLLDKQGSSRVVRGGSWGDPADYCRAACRHHVAPGSRYHGFGFRLAESFKE